ncbi:MAG: hypothetical protein RI563_01455 [Thiohalophilus sp.]|uniref:hypothetical protein n=1 Tax=Thiohalophilus sp. TaxID=3028392 RepID=UPI0028709013|nr:hypothetical protein [Thiohalophilus sp.]MDR9435515.1 hypothetical protein [Thiohalophilus sp.]
MSLFDNFIMRKSSATVIDKNRICKRIPHAGDMCLIESVMQWDKDSITCLSRTHVDTNNPLRDANKLPVSALVEYGAQTMAIHGALVNEQCGEHQGGYLAALKNVRFYDGDLSNIQEEIIISAKKIYSDGKNMIYDFSVSAIEKELVSGRATVFGGDVTGEHL